MSGAYGWHRNDTPSPGRSTRAHPDAFGDARKAYSPGPAAKARTIDPSPPPASSRVADASIHALVRKEPTPGVGSKQKTTARNVLIIAMDVTGSMRVWPQEIRRRMAFLYLEACKYLGNDDTEILFIAYGDAAYDHHALQVARLGRGPELEVILESFELEGGGGGNGAESAELVAYKVVSQIDTSAATNVHLFFITDEPGQDKLKSTEVKTLFGTAAPDELSSTKTLMRLLQQRMEVYAILCETQSYDPSIASDWWKQMIDPSHVLPLDDARRVVDVMLGALAAVTGQLVKYTADLRSRHAGSRYADINVGTVLNSVAPLAGAGTPSDPYVFPGGGTKSLLAKK